MAGIKLIPVIYMPAISPVYNVVMREWAAWVQLVRSIDSCERNWGCGDKSATPLDIDHRWFGGDRVRNPNSGQAVFFA